jgi:competence protein ComEC
MIFGVAILSFQVFVRQLPSLIPKKTFIIFHQSKQSLIGFQTDQHLEIHHDLDTIEKNRTVIDFKIGAGIKTQTSDSIRRLYQVNNKLLLVVDSLGIYNLKSVNPNWILLRQSPKINLNRLIDSLQPELIIWDGSNYNSYQKRWKLTCKAKKIPFYQTSEKGSFSLYF